MQQKNVKKKTGTKPAGTSPGRLELYLLSGAVAVLTFFSFSPALKNSFINQDDNIYVFDNQYLSKPIEQAVAYFFGPHYFSGNYIPLTMIGYTFAYKVAGITPEFFHTVNVLIHLLNTLLVFWFIYLLSGKKPLVAAIVSLFFGIHPMHVESVAWVAELKDVLYSCFFLAGLIAYFIYTEPDKNEAIPEARVQQKSSAFKQMATIFAFFVLSVLSKPAAIVFPFVLLLLDFYLGRKPGNMMWLEKLPFVIVSVIFGIIAIKAQHADNLINTHYPFTQRLLFAPYAFLAYLVKLFAPVHLSAFYPFPSLTDGHLPYLYYVTPVVLAVLIYGVYRTLKYSRLVAFGFLFFFVNIVLVLQLLPIGNAIIADRYTYIPYIGLFFIIATGFDRLYKSNDPKLKAYKSAALTTLIIFAVICSGITYGRCEVWESQDTMSIDIADKFPDDPIALNNRGYILYKQQKYRESISILERALRLKPDYTMAYANITNCYIAMKDYATAMKYTDTALKYAPEDFNFLTTKGYLLSTQQKYPDAMSYYREALKVKQKNVEGYVGLANCYYAIRDFDNEIKTLDAGLIYSPDNPVLLNNKGYALFLLGKYSDAAEYYKAALKSKPDFNTASINLADCYKAMNRPK